MPKVDFKRVETDEEIQNLEIIDGQLIYSKTGKTFMDYGNERIPTGSGGGSEVVISEEEPTTEDWKIWIDKNEINNIGSEVVDTLEGNETNKAPSVRAVNDTKGKILWTNLNPTEEFTNQTIKLSSSDYDYLIIIWYTGGNNFDSTIIPKGRTTIMQTMIGLEDNTNISARYRNMTYIDDTSYSIEDGYEKLLSSTSITINNARMIPYKFIGLKLD